MGPLFKDASRTMSLKREGRSLQIQPKILENAVKEVKADGNFEKVILRNKTTPFPKAESQISKRDHHSGEEVRGVCGIWHLGDPCGLLRRKVGGRKHQAEI